MCCVLCVIYYRVYSLYLYALIIYSIKLYIHTHILYTNCVCMIIHHHIAHCAIWPLTFTFPHRHKDYKHTTLLIAVDSLLANLHLFYMLAWNLLIYFSTYFDIYLLYISYIIYISTGTHPDTRHNPATIYYITKSSPLLYTLASRRGLQNWSSA